MQFLAAGREAVLLLFEEAAESACWYNNSATRNGALIPDRTLAGANTQLLGPVRLYLSQ